MRFFLSRVAVVWICMGVNTLAAVHFVDGGNQNPIPPFSDWQTAAATIQDAIDVANPGDEILVTNGLYQTGGSVANDATTNRVTINKSLFVHSVNGPLVTVIRGYQPPGVAGDETSIRCVYLAHGASLCGFTLKEGSTPFTLAGGGASGEFVYPLPDNWATVSNCFFVGNSASSGGAAAQVNLVDCVLSNNWVDFQGGAVHICTVTRSLIQSNFSLFDGGAAYDSTLKSCLLKWNMVRYGQGGAAVNSTLEDCFLIENYSRSGGGGVNQSFLNRCTLTGNHSSQGYGGGANASSLTNCLLTANSADMGGGAAGGILINCTVCSNSAFSFGGGVDVEPGYCKNSIIYFNNAPQGSNYSSSTLQNCCATPLPQDGSGNITNDPRFVNLMAGNFRLQTNSPCIDAGFTDDQLPSTDLDGRNRILGSAVDIGAFEFISPGMGEFVGWLAQFGISTDGSGDFADSDADGLNNWQEWIAGTDPTDRTSKLQVCAPVKNGSGMVISWQSVTNRIYILERSASVGLNQQSFIPIATNISGAPGVTSYTDTNSAESEVGFYRVGVQ